MPGSNVGGFGGIFQELISPTKYPKIPDAPFVDPQSAQRTSISGNLAALPGLEQLGSQVNSFNLGQRQQQLNQSIPGFQGLVSQGSQNMSDWLHGVIPGDVSSAVARGTNAQAIAGGYGGSGAAANLTARDLGLTSLNLQQGATAALPGFLGSIAGLLLPHPFDVTSGFMSPEGQINSQQWNELYRYKQQALVNQIAALPDPLMAAVGSAIGSQFNQDLATAQNAGGILGGGRQGDSTGQSLFQGGAIGTILGGGGGGGAGGASSLLGMLG